MRLGETRLGETRLGERRVDGRRAAGTQRGFAYVALLAVLALLGLALAEVSTRLSDELQREREQQLLRVGAVYAQAIASYYRGSPGSQKTYPSTLDDLLRDPRMLGTVRHLRAAYGDPMRPGQPLALVRAADGTLRGVHSTSDATPFLAQGVDLGITSLAPARRYLDWQFIPKVDP